MTDINFICNIKKITRNLDDYGVAETCRKGILHMLGPIYRQRKYRIYRRDLFGGLFAALSPCGCTFQLVDQRDTGVIRQIESMIEWLDGELIARLDRGDLCMVALDGANVVGVNLIAFENVFIPLINLNKRLRPHQAWSEQITVRKSYRNQDLATALRYRIFSELQRRGIRTLYGGTLLSNTPSLKLAEKVGFKFIADVKYEKIMKRESRTFNRIKDDGN